MTSNKRYSVSDGSNPFFDGRAFPKFNLRKSGVQSGHVQKGLLDPFCFVLNGKGKCHVTNAGLFSGDDRYTTKNSVKYGAPRDTDHPELRQPLEFEVWQSISKLMKPSSKITILTSGPSSNLAQIILKDKNASSLIEVKSHPLVTDGVCMSLAFKALSLEAEPSQIPTYGYIIGRKDKLVIVLVAPIAFGWEFHTRVLLYEVFYFQNFLLCPISSSLLSSLASIEWKSFGLNVKSSAIDENGDAVLEWENLPPLVHISHCKVALDLIYGCVPPLLLSL
ncbi:hypothetical protein Syun_022698 [Stephania yunnanensis]|uniref:Uncharacterized protein n=1 Tax=Stephania yunnanensis TaxID=152371 RepID=A0AAP0FA59_9MAGN